MGKVGGEADKRVCDMFFWGVDGVSGGERRMGEEAWGSRRVARDMMVNEEYYVCGCCRSGRDDRC